MARQPIQVIVIPFRRSGTTFEYCVLRRSDNRQWQFIAGGVESDEAPVDAAKRESHEEAGLSNSSDIVCLDSTASIPANIFCDWKQWPPGTYVVKELAFGIEASDKKITLSREHLEFRWCEYEEALALLHWDSNKTALWELSQRLHNLP